MVKTTGASVGVRIYIVVLIIGLFMVISSAGDAITLFTKDAVNLNGKEISEFYEGEMVQGKAEYVWDTIATLETSRTVYGIPVSKSSTPYYLVYVNFDADTSNGYYVLMHITDKETITGMDSLMMETERLLMSDGESTMINNIKPIGLNTKTVKIPGEVKEYLYRYFEEGGMTKAECDELVADCVLEQCDYTQAKILPLIGLGLMLISTLIFFAGRKGKKSKTTYVNEFPSGGFVPQNGNAQNTSDSTAQNPYYSDNSGTSGQMDEINTDDIFK
ncbi:MAG: hypothetical protein Q4E74_07045 [Ruminococcus sp.]|nr:hypothetical protein [Ruminococcus sp.]